MRTLLFGLTVLLSVALPAQASLHTQRDYSYASTVQAQPEPSRLFALPDIPVNAVKLAHAILVKANPAQESTITDVPEEVLLIFNDSVGQEFLALAVIDPTGKRVDNHDAKLDFTDHSHLRASVSKLAPGRYTVRYRVLSADGHVVSGKYFFDVQSK
jgi:methionine-rich copper-binding protein CopC